MTRVTLRPADGAPSITLSGDEVALLRALNGIEVWVAGKREDPRRMTVSRFAVRAVGGLPAHDGTLLADGDALTLQAADGRRVRIHNPPPALRQHVGARVWLSGDLAKEPDSFGVIRH